MPALATAVRPPVPPAVNARAALAGFFRIMELWGVGNEEARTLLGAPGQTTYFGWKRGDAPRLPQDVLRRIGYVAGIYKALQIVYGEAELADSWVRRPNRAFNDQTPLQRMLGGDVTDLAAVRAYLDAARAPWS